MNMKKTNKERMCSRSFWGWRIILGTGFLMVCFLGTKGNRKQMMQSVWQEIASWSFSTCLISEQIKQQDHRMPCWITDAVPLLGYIDRNETALPLRQTVQMKGLVLLYPGKNSDRVFWSGAASHRQNERQLFQEADAEIGRLLLAEQGEQDAESVAAAAILENEKQREQNGQTAADSEREKASEKRTDPAEDKKADGSQTSSETEVLDQNSSRETAALAVTNKKKIQLLKRNRERSYLIRNFYIVDSSTSIDPKLFDVDTFLQMDLRIKKKNKPQILIFHTHGASEAFADSAPGDAKESVIGVGSKLTSILEKKYGYQVLHDKTPYDSINGRIDRNKAYNKAYSGLKSTLKKYPSIEVVIDLHRDGVGNKVHRLTTIRGKKTAQVMFFNGLSRNRKGNIRYLKNENLQANLSFSLQMKLKSMELYPDFAKPVYLKGYRYNLHLRKRSLLIELGNENNTLAEANNAMKPLAEVLNQVLSGK